MPKPWILWGGYNAVVSKYRSNGVPITDHEISNFTECVHFLNLAELQWKGDYYTWSNKKKGVARVQSQINRALGNVD